MVYNLHARNNVVFDLFVDTKLQYAFFKNREAYKLPKFNSVVECCNDSVQQQHFSKEQLISPFVERYVQVEQNFMEVKMKHHLPWLKHGKSPFLCLLSSVFAVKG